MITAEVLAFIKDQDAKGVSRESTRLTLMSQGGWSKENIDEAFTAVPTIYAAPTDGTPRPPQPISPPVRVHKEPNMFLTGLGTVCTILAVFVAAGVAAYFFVPQVQEDISFITGAVRGSY